MAEFVIDTCGDQQQSAATALYSTAFRERFLDDDNLDNDDGSDIEAGEVELFGVKVSGKDVRQVVKSSTEETGSKAPSKVALQLTELTEKVKQSAENTNTHKLTKRQRITDLHYDASETLNERKANVDMDMQKTKRIPGFQQLKALPTVSRRKQPILNRAEREKTKGSGWFDLPATEITDTMRNELKIIQMRSVLDPKHFYKKNDLKVLPKYFQVGTVQHSPLDHYSERHTRKTKKSLVDELLADESFAKFNKRKYNEVIKRTDKYAHRKAIKKMKKLKR